MEGASISCDEATVDSPQTLDVPKELPKSASDISEDARILSVDRLTVEKIVLEKGGSREILLTKSESKKRISELTKFPSSKLRSTIWRKRSSSTDDLSSSARIQKFNIINALDWSLVTDGRKIEPKIILSLKEKRISPVKLTKSSSIGSLVNIIAETSNLGKNRKIPPKVPAKPKKKTEIDVPRFEPNLKSADSSKNSAIPSETLIDKEKVSDNASKANTQHSSQFGNDLTSDSPNDVNSTTRAHEFLEKSQWEIERLQKNLRTQINVTTAQTYKQKLPGLGSLRPSTISDLDLNENITKTNTFDKEFLERHNYDTKLRIEEKRLFETNVNFVPELQNNDDPANFEKPRYSKKVLEIEKRWSGEFLEKNFGNNSSESSYVEELGSVSSRESIKTEAERKFGDSKSPSKYEAYSGSSRKDSAEEIFEETVSTVDSDSCLEERIRAIEDDISESVKTEDDDDVGSKRKSESKTESTREVSQSIKKLEPAEPELGGKEGKSVEPLGQLAKPENVVQHDVNDKETRVLESSKNCPKNCYSHLARSDITEDNVFHGCPTQVNQAEFTGARLSADGYANLIKEFTMEANSSKVPKEEKKKRSGLRRLLPGIFSPKDSRKEYKKEQKERKKREEKHFNQHQQNGIYTRSPDTMNLNEDITRNVKLDTSLNSSIIEERLNEIKQELFPEQGMTTSTPDHFLQNDRTLVQDPRAARSFTVNSSLSSIAPEDKWLDHNIISGSPDMRKFKHLRNENERKCSLERKHSLQESANQPRFLRNHGPSGRISAPPSDRFLIRPRAVHPVDRPLPAIPQKVEISNYENHEEIRKHPNYFRRQEIIETPINYPTDSYGHVTGNENYINDPSLYENGNHMVEKTEINRNQSIDSGFNLTPVSAQVKITRQLIVNQNQKAPLIGRSPKYSPSSSQKSGDYADSSYTPNSSQKSEFSPGSSKSGEYYLNSPRNSCRTSPDESLNERRDQQPTSDQQQHQPRRRDMNQDQEFSHAAPHPVSPKVRVQPKNDRVYDVAPMSPLQEIRVDKPSPNPRQIITQVGLTQDASYALQKGSPNIPMSTNLAKLRANVEGSVNDRPQSPDNADRVNSETDRHTSLRITSPIPSSRTLASPVQFRDSLLEREDKEQRSSIQGFPRVMSPTRIQRIASPLTILTPGNQSPVPTSIASPSGVSSINGNHLPADTKPMTSPRILVQDLSQEYQQRRQPNQSHQPRTPIMSPNIGQNRVNSSSGSCTPMSSFSSRRAQPNDQILIASPKREASIYETRVGRLPGTTESSCPDSPIPMAESPSQVLIPRTQTARQNVLERNRIERLKSPTGEASNARDQADQARKVEETRQRASPIVRPMSPSADTRSTQKHIQRPEPIYLRRDGAQRVLSPMTIQPEGRRESSPVVFVGENRADTLLVPVRPENNIRNRGSSCNQRQKEQETRPLQTQCVDDKASAQESTYVERRVQSPTGTSRMHSQRPEVIYVQRDQSSIAANPEPKHALHPNVTSPSQRGNQLQQHMGMDSRRVRRASETIYEDHKSAGSRGSLINEQIYGSRHSRQSPASPRQSVDSRQRQDDVGVQSNQGPPETTRLSQQQQYQREIYASKQEMLADNRQVLCGPHESSRKDPTYGQRQAIQQQEPIYGQRSSEPIYGQHTNRQLSPSKRQMMQHLEAFYWQQKALDAQRKSANSPTPSGRAIVEGKIESPEVREAIYWQQLKKLDEEQQRKIFESNSLDERSDPHCQRKQIPCSGSLSFAGNPSRHGSAPSLANQSFSVPPMHQNQQQLLDNSAEQIYWQTKVQNAVSQMPVGKPPMIGQKGQNQPILIVRPQQAVRELDRTNQGMIYDERDGETVRQDGPRSKSVSPRFTRGDERRSLSLPRNPVMLNDQVRENVKVSREVRLSNATNSGHISNTPPIYELHDIEGMDGMKKPLAPPPIFKRGSLISNSSSSVDYGTMGTKRVSFSNQANSPEVGSGNWPTKHGMAPEPPTRKHRTEDRTSISSETNDPIYLQGQDDNQSSANSIYGNVAKCNSAQSERISDDQISLRSEQRNALYEAEYDAKPLPPPPRESSWMLKRSSSMKDSSGNGGRIPRIEIQRAKVPANPRKWPGVSESESGSEAGEVQKILQRRNEEEWNPGGKGRQSNDTGGSGRAEGEGGSNDLAGGRRGGGGSGGVLGGGRGSGTSGSGGGGAGGRSRDEPRRHTLSGDHQPSLHHQQFNTQQLHPLHPHHLPPPHGQYGTPPNRHTTMDLEMGTKSRQRKSPLPRGYPPPSSTMLFDDDPGIMSEVETSSTGFRRGGKQRSSLPVVRTPSKTLERPLGQVFLQYRNETKRALLPNEITSIDTVKALFVRSFSKQLTMEYLDSPHVKVYIHDSNKNMFYELEDLRSHLRDIRDRSVLRLFESTDGVAGMPGPMGVPVGGAGLPPHWEDQSYFSEPEFDSEFQHQHIHKSKTSKNSTSGSRYYMGGSSTLPRGGSLMRAYSPATSSVVAGPNATPTQPKALGTPDRLHGESGYMSSPERGGGVGTGSGRYPGGPYSTGSSYEEPYYSQYSGTVTPVIDEEARIRVEQMERQLANLTGLVQKALTHAPHTSPSPRDYLQVPAGRDPYTRTTDKSVSFEKSVSFSDEPPDMNSPKQHSPQHAERDRHKPTPPPKPVALAAGQYVYRDLALTPEMYNQLRGLQKKAKDLRQDVRNLRRMSQTQAYTVQETIRDTFITIRAMLLSGGEAAWAAGDTEKMRLSRDEDLYKQEMIRLEKDLTELESTVEELRGNVINRKTRVNMSDVETMALILSKSSKTVADLKVRFPSLQEGMKGLLSSEMEKVVREEKFLKEEPERLESALRRCKKLTGTLVTLKRLASVQEQRSPNAASVDAEETPPVTPTSAQHSKTTAPVPAERTVVGSAGVIGGGAHAAESSAPNQQRPENALDALLDELQTFSRPTSQLSQVSFATPGQSTNHTPHLSEIGRSASQIVQSSGRAPSMSDIGRKGSIDSSTSLAIVAPPQTNALRRLHSYPSSSDTDTSPPIARLQTSENTVPILPVQKPPVPERNAELLQLATSRRIPPPPPPRTSSRSPLASPTSPQLPPRNPTGTLRRGRASQKDSGKPPMALPANAATNDDLPPPGANNMLSASNSSSCESINSQEGLQNKKGRQEQLEQRHQELLRKQKALQEQYARLQQLHRNASGLTTVPPAPPDLLKKTGSESNLLAKMGLGLSTTSSGSLTSLTVKANADGPLTGQQQQPEPRTVQTTTGQTTTSKIYETDIL